MRPRRTRTLLRAALSITATAALVIAAPGAANAAIGPVHTAPTSGPPGTTFTVSGSGCGPGLTVSGADYASVSSSSLPLNIHAPVNSAGSWSATFSVPSGSLPVPALIAAACFTDGLPSLTTIYTPATFIVTAAPSPTTTPPPPPPPTSPTTSGSTGTTATTKATTGSTKPGGKGSGTGGGTGPGSGTGTSSASEKSGRSRTSNGRGGAGGASGGSTAKRSGTVANLRSPELASDSQRASSGISPWWWVLLALLAAGATATWLWLRRRGASTGAPDASMPLAADEPVPGEAAPTDPGDDLDDDWPAFPVLDEEPTIRR